VFTQEDHHYMALAIKLAKQGHYTTSPNPRVGCVLVNNIAGTAQIIGKGFHQKAGQGHAEVNALADARLNYPKFIEGATAYVTLEPCSHFGRTPPCAQALIDSKVARVVSAMVDPNPTVSGRGIAMLEEAGIKAESGLLESEAKTLNRGFIKLMSESLPYVRIKLAASLDGKTAMKNGESKWITSSEARKDVQRLRAESCAIISGADSILTDNAKMTVRWSELGELQQSYQEDTVRQLPSVKNNAGENKVDLTALLTMLAKRGLNEVLVESGANLAGVFIEQDLADELILYQAPKLMGGDGKNLLEMPNVLNLSQAKSLKIKDVRLVGSDIRITAKLTKSLTQHK